MRWAAAAVFAGAACGRFHFDEIGGDQGAPIALATLTVGARHACGLDPTGVAHCWGYNASGQLGQAAGAPIPFATRVGDASTKWTALAAGGDHTCALRDGQAWCWGENANGETLGAKGGTTSTPAPVVIGATPPPFDQIAAGGHVSCAIGAGQLWCWGLGVFSGTGIDPVVPTRVGALDDWTTVALSDSHGCGISASQGVLCWGANYAGQIGGNPGPDVTTPMPVAINGMTPIAIGVGRIRSCAIVAASAAASAGELWCWGDDDLYTIDDSLMSRPPTRIGTDREWTSIAPGNLIMCGLLRGQRHCWGFGFTGAMGDGVWEHAVHMFGASVPLGPADAVVLNSPTAGVLTDDFGCVRVGTEVSCWGLNSVGQMALGYTATAIVPEEVISPTGRPWAHMSAEIGHVCASTDDGAVWCWGLDRSGQVTGMPGRGVPGSPCIAGAHCDQSIPIRASIAAAEELIAFADRTCARNGSIIQCWGGDTAGTSTIAAPNGTWTKLTGAPQAPCGFTTTGQIGCWGGVIGAYQSTPIMLSGAELHDISSVAMGWTSACATRSIDNARVCFGLNDEYNLGDGTTTNRPMPIALDIGSVGKATMTVYRGGCALTPGGGVECWGRNNASAVGQPKATVNVPTPAPVFDVTGPLQGCTAISAAVDHTCAICSATALCWGANGHAELGRGGPTDEDHIARPVVLPTTLPIVEIAATDGGGHALDSGGNLFCWGAHEHGNCGNGKTGFPYPVPIRAR